MARAAFVQLLEALASGTQDKVWEGLSAQSHRRIRGQAEPAKQGPSEKARAVEVLRGIVGHKATIKGVRGTRSGVEIEVEYAPGKSRDLEMLPEGGTWKLNLFSS
jgi:hypothetical protein